MALTFPLALPASSLRVRDRKFKLSPANIESPTWGGLVQSVNVGRSLFIMRYDLITLRGAVAQELLSLLGALRDGARPFKALDPLRRLAAAYPNGYAGMTKAGGGAFTGTAVLEDVGVAMDTISLSGLPNGFVLSPGDLLSFSYDTTRQALHEVVETATASGLGVVTVQVEPPVIPGWEAEAEVALADPWCKAQLVRDSVTENWTANRRCTISFQARQDIRP